MESASTNLDSYLQEQLAYDHTDEKLPSNTRAMIFNQHRLIRKAIVAEARRQPIHLLDIGCGWGDLCGKLHDVVVDYVGVEPSLVELQRFACNQRKWLIRGIGEHLAFLRSSSRNVILMNSVLDHCLDWRRTLDNCMRILAPGGILVISMENADKIPIRLLTLLGRQVKHEGHVAFFSMKELVRILQANEMQIERQCSIGFLFGFHDLTRKIPISETILRIVNRAADVVGGSIVREGGHVMFVVARKKSTHGPYEIPSNPLQCCTCERELTFASEECPNCHRRYSYIDGAFLDTTGDPEFRASNEVPRHI
jgi:ubiquinone/menaquinone biosynthesis C-methylase UbiE